MSFKNKKRKGINAKSSQNKNDEEKALNVTE
ncbi:MAG: hypothetical protein ACI9YH_002860, partial [Colwellia sp.]